MSYGALTPSNRTNRWPGVVQDVVLRVRWASKGSAFACVCRDQWSIAGLGFDLISSIVEHDFVKIS